MWLPSGPSYAQPSVFGTSQQLVARRWPASSNMCSRSQRDALLVSLRLSSWRHHPSATVQRRLLPAVVRPQISTSPAADRAAATALYLWQRFLCVESLDRQLA